MGGVDEKEKSGLSQAQTVDEAAKAWVYRPGPGNIGDDCWGCGSGMLAAFKAGADWKAPTATCPDCWAGVTGHCPKCGKAACAAPAADKERIRELEVALSGLVKLKNHKVTYGDDESYRNLKPVMWANAFRAVGVEQLADVTRPVEKKTE